MISLSIKRRIIDLAKEGKPPRSIAAELQLDTGDVTAIICKARNAGQDIPRFRKPNGWREPENTVLFPSEVLARLYPHARRRGCTSNELARRIVNACLDDNLIDSVLDDIDPARSHAHR